ncbi:MAG: acetate uptake transporter [Vulcanimicrobiaceae bacterium]
MTQVKFANPAPLGLAGFALTTFLLSCVNAGWLSGSDVWVGFAVAYGGAAQLCAGMWEFASGNTFGAVAFSSYGAFWLGTAIYVWFFAGHAKSVGTDLAYLLGAWTIFTAYMTAIIFRTDNGPVKGVFGTLLITFILLWLGAWFGNASLTVIGGYLGVITALAAWYASWKMVNDSIAA